MISRGMKYFYSLPRFAFPAFAFLFVTTCIFSTGCGKTPAVNTVVKNVQVKSYVQNGENWLQAIITLSTGNFPLAALNVPIIDPTNSTKEYGQIALAPSLCGSGCNGGDLSVAVNLTDITGASTLTPILPNGTQLPIAGLQNASVIALPIGLTNARLYFAFGPGIAMMGTAIPFSALDPAGKYIPGADLFIPAQFPPIALTAGMFFGATANTTGVGVFMDLSGVLNKQLLLTNVSRELSSSTDKPSALILQTVKPSKTTEQKIYRKLYELNSKGPTLELKKK